MFRSFLLFGYIISDAMSYDVFLRDFEVLYDPARGGSSSKLALASLPVITFFNKIKMDYYIKSIAIILKNMLLTNTSITIYFFNKCASTWVVYTIST